MSTNSRGQAVKVLLLDTALDGPLYDFEAFVVLHVPQTTGALKTVHQILASIHLAK